MAKEKVSVILRQNQQGHVYGLTYIDHNTKSVFNGSDLGKSFSAKNILNQLNRSPEKQSDKSPDKEQQENKVNNQPEKQTSSSGKTSMFQLFENLIQPEGGTEAVAAELRQEEKRRRRTIDHDQEYEM